MIDQSPIAPGEESFFTILRSRRHLAKLVVDSIDRPSELLALKTSVPEYADISIIALRDSSFGRMLEFGPFAAQRAYDRFTRMKKYGLRVRMVDVIEVSEVLIDDRGPSALLIEDPIEMQRVIEDAIRRGVRVVEEKEAEPGATDNPGYAQ